MSTPGKLSSISSILASISADGGLHPAAAPAELGGDLSAATGAEASAPEGQQHTAAAEPQELQQREEALAAREIEMALSEAQLRGQEGHVSAMGAALAARGGWIDTQVAQLAQWAAAAGVDAEPILHGLGGGAASEEADLARYVDRSETLLIGRAAMIATRAEVLQRRADQLADREQELAAFEQAFVRAEVRLTARERLLREAIGRLQAAAGGHTVPELAPTPTAARTERLSPRHPRHAQTVSMSAREHAVLNASILENRGSAAPPVLDLSAGLAWQQPTRPMTPSRQVVASDPAMGAPATASASSTRPAATPMTAPPPATAVELSLAGFALGRSDVEVDRASRVVLASVAEQVNLTGLVDLVGKDARGEAHCFPVRVQLVIPGNDGVGSAVVLSAGSWSDADFDDFEDVLSGLR